MSIKEIQPGQGLGDLKLGMTEAQVQAVLGEPGEKEVFEIEGEKSINWHYDTLELSLAFDEVDEFKLGTISVSGGDYTIQGENVFGKNEDDLIALLNKLGMEDLDQEDWSSEESPNHRLVADYVSDINFWLDDDAVSEIQWGPLYDEDDEPIWAV